MVSAHQASPRKVSPNRRATVARAPFVQGADRRLAAIMCFPAAVALAERIGVERGLDVDRPAWTDDYYRVARTSA